MTKASECELQYSICRCVFWAHYALGEQAATAVSPIAVDDVQISRGTADYAIYYEADGSREAGKMVH